MKTIECRRVSLWDGGGRHDFGFRIANNVTEAEIKKAHPHCMIQAEVLTVFDTLEEVEENNVRSLRRSAWHKLSPLERKALGMMEEPK